MTVILFDLETTGLPSKAGLRFGETHAFTDTPKYDSARVVQISFMVCSDQLLTLSLHDYVINSDNEFKITNSHIHGITDARSLLLGKSFDAVMDEFREALLTAHTVIAHNADFDVNVLKAELFRRGSLDLLDQLDSKSVVCTMKACKTVVNAQSVYHRLKYPSLKELYEFATGKVMQRAHDAKYDVLNMHEAIKSLFERQLFQLTPTPPTINPPRPPRPPHPPHPSPQPHTACMAITRK